MQNLKKRYELTHRNRLKGFGNEFMVIGWEKGEGQAGV